MPQSYENIPRFPNKSGRNVSLGARTKCSEDITALSDYVLWDNVKTWTEGCVTLVSTRDSHFDRLILDYLTNIFLLFLI
jgi:hypothetical protein